MSEFFSATVSPEDERRARWRAIAEEVDNYTDANNMPIDHGIRDSLVAFKANELPTAQSCEGHLDRGLPYPWVTVAEPNEPEDKFVGEKELFERTAKEAGIPVEELRRAHPEDLYDRVLKEASTADYTEEYKKWMIKQEQLMRKADSLIEEFYQGRGEIAPEIRIVNDFGTIKSDEKTQSFEYIGGQLDPAERERMKVLFEPRRTEMASFSQFLKDRFFNRPSQES